MQIFMIVLTILMTASLATIVVGTFILRVAEEHKKKILKPLSSMSKGVKEHYGAPRAKE